MGWKSFFTSDPESGESVKASAKVNDKGHVSDLIYDTDRDARGGKHGHIWGLDSDDDKDIGGRNKR